VPYKSFFPEGADLGVKFNITKSVAMRIGPKYDSTCDELILYGKRLVYEALFHRQKGSTCNQYPFINQKMSKRTLDIKWVKQACAANRRYSMRRRKCKQKKRYHTSARLTLTYNKSTSGHGTDGQTDRVQRNMRHPPTEEGAA